jgi:2-methylcitrate dehydratase PrpD
MTSVTQQLAEWIAKADYDDIPDVALRRVEERVVDSLGVQFAGMSVPTGDILSRYVQGFGAAAESSVVSRGFKTTAAFATLANAAAGHALEFDDIAAFSGHYANPMTAATLAVGEKLDASGRDVILAWMVGYEVIWRTAKPTMGNYGSKLLGSGWFNQGFQPVLGVAAATAKLMGLDITQTRMALGNAASAMAGVMKNRGSDSKGFTAGSAAMHGVMAAELMAMGFTANEDILDGDDGVMRMIGQEVGDPEKVVEDLGSWDMATRGSTMRLNASCAAGHWSMAAMGQIVEKRPLAPEEIESIEIRLPAFLLPNMPYHDPRTGLEAKYSLEYDVVTVALNGRGGMYQYTDAEVQRPEAKELMRRIEVDAIEGDLSQVALESRVVVTLKDGERLEASANRAHGTVHDPLTEEEMRQKFHECATAVVPLEAQRDEVMDLAFRLRSLPSVRELTEAAGTIRTS